MVRSQRDETQNLAGNYNNGVYTTCPAEAIVDNATNNVTISNVAPAAVGTATISKWLPILVDGTTYFIPMWT